MVSSLRAKMAGKWALIAAAVLPVVCLLPFVGKAFHIDDPVFIWVAQQIRQHPLDFFGFDAYWSDTYQSMFDINKNPPGISYYIALASTLFGDGEVALHLAFLVPAAALGVAIYLLARRFCQYPIVAAASVILTPIFLTCGSSVMSDMMMTAFFAWAVLMWEWSLDKPSLKWGMAAALFIALGALTKYFAIALVPLLGLYTLLRNPRQVWRAFPLVLSLAIMMAYELYTRHLYGKGMLAEAQGFAHSFSAGDSSTLRIVATIGFLGGCYPAGFMFAAAARRWRPLCVSLATAVAAVTVLMATGAVPADGALSAAEHIPWLLAVQWVLMVAAGMLIILIAAGELVQSRDAHAALLFSWLAGTLLFCIFVNWTLSARILLPAAPVVGILTARLYQQRHPQPQNQRVLLLKTWPLLVIAPLAFAVVWADYRCAEANRQAPSIISAQFPGPQAHLFYMGHFGFQLYMDAANAKPIDFDKTRVMRKDVIVVPHNNSSTVELEQPFATLSATIRVPACRWLATSAPGVGAGFYSFDRGRKPLPYAFGPVEDESYNIYTVN